MSGGYINIVMVSVYFLLIFVSVPSDVRQGALVSAIFYKQLMTSFKAFIIQNKLSKSPDCCSVPNDDYKNVTFLNA